MTRVVFGPLAVAALARIPDRFAKQIVKRAEALGIDPHPRGSLKLHGEESVWRVRSGDYRILYTVRAGVVEIVNIGDRKEVYR